ncbi:MAG: hypothetical protein ACOY9Y_13490 [Bacillota bacterium]
MLLRIGVLFLVLVFLTAALGCATTGSIHSNEGSDYKVESLALPYGAKPKNYQLSVEGEHGGISYRHQAVLLVGSHPAPSPVSINFNSAAIPRIRASDPFLEQWINHFRQNPLDRYVSDGAPTTVTVPKLLKDKVDLSKYPGLTLVVFEGNGAPR